MKYMCKTCKKPCNDIPEHIRKVHGFSEAHIKEDLKNCGCLGINFSSSLTNDKANAALIFI